jgi:lipopolysaccharide biosynthesis glycosyltransferase
MIVLKNIDELFEKPSMSAVQSGGMLPRKKDSTQMNTGLIVLEPNREIFNDMIKKIGTIENLKSEGTKERPVCGSDQDFLNLYFTDWTKNIKVQLNHKYNMIHYQFDEYNSLFGFTIEPGPNAVSIIHFASYIKPWSLNKETEQKIEKASQETLEIQSIKIWLNTYDTIEIK